MTISIELSFYLQHVLCSPFFILYGTHSTNTLTNTHARKHTTQFIVVRIKQQTSLACSGLRVGGHLGEASLYSLMDAGSLGGRVHFLVCGRGAAIPTPP